MASACDRCGRRAVIHIRYSGRHLCRDHFLDFYVRRVRRELSSGRRIERRVVVAVSGGKDSMALLHALYRILVPRRVELVAVVVDEGIAGYRDRGLGIVRSYAEDLDVELALQSFREDIGATLDDIMARRPPRGACSYCGVFRRHLINSAAMACGADVVATGHTLDDMAQTGLMNFLRGDVDRIVRTGPHRWVQEGLVPRIMPLRWIPEKENMLYCHLLGVPHHHAECPYSGEAHRQMHRRIVLGVEADTPGSRHAILNATERIVDLYMAATSPPSLSRCTRCGAPSNRDVCMRCRYIEELGLGEDV